MAEYTAREWSNGDIVTASNLNQIESGVEAVAEESGLLIVNGTEVTENDTTYLRFNKTWQQIYDAFPNVYIILMTSDYEFYKANITSVYKENETYLVNGANKLFAVDSPNGYPQLAIDGSV